MKAALRSFLGRCAFLFKAPVAATAINSAVDLAFRLADGGSIGLLAWARALRRPELIAHQATAGIDASGCAQIPDLLEWALRFPAVWGCSEGNNVVDLGGLLGPSGATVWIELPSSHFESIEHQLVSALVDLVMLDLLLSGRCAGNARNGTPVPPLFVHAFPVS